MCRLLGIVTAAPYEFGLVLREAPRSMAILSREHRDGWGIATHAGIRGYDWALHKSVRTADEDPAFVEQAKGARGRVVIAHVRQKTVGPLALPNTHPFRRGDWVFAHNGTVKDVAWVEAHTPPSRLAEREGATDSELFFAYLLGKLDEAGVTEEPASRRADDAIRRAVLTATDRADFGTVNFLLSNGSALYASRFGRPLHLLERAPGEDEGAPDDGAPPADGEVPIERRRCVVIASEPLTEERWTPIEQGAMLRLEVGREPRWVTID